MRETKVIENQKRKNLERRRRVAKITRNEQVVKRRAKIHLEIFMKTTIKFVLVHLCFDLDTS